MHRCVEGQHSHSHVLLSSNVAEDLHAVAKQMQLAPFGLYGMGLLRWVDICGGFYYGHGGDWAGYRTVVLTSADAKRQIAIAITYPPESWDPADYDPTNPLSVEAMHRAARTALDLSC